MANVCSAKGCLLASEGSGTMLTAPDEARWRPQRGMTFALADGTTVERSVSEAHLTLPQGQAHTPVILGEPNDQALLGVVTLEILGLVFNPFDRTLQPMHMLLA